jgi:hypothetical protein
MNRNAFFTSLVILMCGQVLAATPTAVNYQGRLTNGSGSPVPDGNYTVVFTIYDAASGGTGRWSESQSVTTSSGLFSVMLGSGSPITDSVFSGTTRYLGIRVGTDPELAPRTRLVTVPYAYRVATVDGASGGSITGNLGIGTASPQAKLHVSGEAEGLRIQGNGVGAPGGAYASFYDAAGSGIGYVGDGSSGDEDVYVTSYIGDVNLYTPAGAALTASASGNVGIGTTTPQPTRKLDVSASEPVLVAIFGRSTAETGEGVIGVADGSFAYGVWGVSLSGEAGHFSGDVWVVGTLSKQAGLFKIDHPLDPANKYLNHSFVESPDMKNIYDGVVTLDVNGEALIQMPEWFGALNRDFRYQLTCIGGYAPVYIAEGLHDNKFRIAGGTPNLAVSWQVTGIRQDAYANAHRIQVEEMKPNTERGFFLAPEVLGFPAEKQIDWARRTELMKQLQDTREKEIGNR